jgi:hypothetical protein
MKEEVIVIFTGNDKLLAGYFQIIPDEFVTIRLVDLQK